MIKLNEIKDKLLKGGFGLELESLRIEPNGYLAHTLHPFPDHENIVRDFCENQVEINTNIEDSAQAVVTALGNYYRQIQETLYHLPQSELLWPFSNPPYIRNEEDIPIANFTGDNRFKTFYRYYLSDRYGRYKMAFSGIHLNYSFSDELLKYGFEHSDQKDYQTYKNQIYLDLAKKLVLYGWIMVAVTAASPVLDSSYLEKGKCGKTTFLGLASIRCSELGYWNFFSPILNYTNMTTYVNSIRSYIHQGWIQAPSELYYPIRLKPKGLNSLETLEENGVNHIELRMIDVNPLATHGIDVRDVRFAQLLICWLALLPKQEITTQEQIQAIQNYKNAAHYDLKTVKIVIPNLKPCSVADAALTIIKEMKTFYKAYPTDVQDVLTFQEEKFINPEKRYAWQIREKYGNDYVKKGINLALSKVK